MRATIVRRAVRCRARVAPRWAGAALGVLLAGGLAASVATAETVHGRVTFVGTLPEVQQPNGAMNAQFRFRLSESRCGTTDGLWTRAWNGTIWTPWEMVSGAPIDSDPVAVMRAGTIGVFALGTDGHIYSLSWQPTGASDWTRLGDDYFSSGPAVAKVSDARIELFARGRADSALWRNVWTGTWSGWSRLSPSPITSDPAAIARGPNRTDVFARGTDNQMYWMFWNGAVWSGWTSLGGGFTSGPGVASWGPSRIDVFGRGTDNTVYRSAMDGAPPWTPWAQVSPTAVASDPAALSVQINSIDLYARGTDNQVYSMSVVGTQASAWSSLGPDHLAGGPGVVWMGGYQVRIFARGGPRVDRWFHVTSGRMDGAFQHNAPNFRNAYSTLLSGLLAHSVTSVQLDGVPVCDEAQVQTLALEHTQIGLYP